MLAILAAFAAGLLFWLVGLLIGADDLELVGFLAMFLVTAFAVWAWLRGVGVEEKR